MLPILFRFFRVDSAIFRSLSSVFSRVFVSVSRLCTGFSRSTNSLQSNELQAAGKPQRPPFDWFDEPHAFFPRPDGARTGWRLEAGECRRDTWSANS